MIALSSSLYPAWRYVVSFFPQIFAYNENLGKKVSSTLPQAQKLVLNESEGTGCSRDRVRLVVHVVLGDG